MDDETREEWLQEHQDGRVYPLGRALRRSWDAENHDTLGSDVTGLMIDLSKVSFESTASIPVQPAVPATAPLVILVTPAMLRSAPPSLIARIGSLIGWRQRT